MICQKDKRLLCVTKTLNLIEGFVTKTFSLVKSYFEGIK